MIVTVLVVLALTRGGAGRVLQLVTAMVMVITTVVTVPQAGTRGRRMGQQHALLLPRPRLLGVRQRVQAAVALPQHASALL
jgi:hypothetical protein